MNVDDIKADEIPEDFSQFDMLDWIYLRQEALSKRYVPIEKANGLRHCMDVPVNLDDRFGQAQLKDMFWRVTEELTEAVDAHIRHPEVVNHTLEELADALHFLIEAYILADMSPARVVSIHTGIENAKTDKLNLLYPEGVEGWRTFEGFCYQVIHHIGCASNCLKQRPWKQTHQLVDRKPFTQNLAKALPSLFSAFRFCGLTPGQVFRMYWKKSEVNKFRIRSNY